MTIVTSSITIAAAPAAVRAKFLDFESLPIYHRDGFFKSITPKDPNTPIVPGSVMINDIELGKFEATMIENSPSKFQWAGGMTGIFYGKHTWQFLEGPDGPQSTTLIQEEDFSGMLSFIIGTTVGWAIGMREKSQIGFEQFNQDLKKAVEQGQ